MSNFKKQLLAGPYLIWKLSVEFYHFVRGWNDNMYRVVAMHKELYDYVTFLSTRNENDRCDRKTH